MKANAAMTLCYTADYEAHPGGFKLPLCHCGTAGQCLGVSLLTVSVWPFLSLTSLEFSVCFYKWDLKRVSATYWAKAVRTGAKSAGSGRNELHFRSFPGRKRANNRILMASPFIRNILLRRRGCGKGQCEPESPGLTSQRLKSRLSMKSTTLSQRFLKRGLQPTCV